MYMCSYFCEEEIFPNDLNRVRKTYNKVSNSFTEWMFLSFVFVVMIPPSLPKTRPSGSGTRGTDSSLHFSIRTFHFNHANKRLGGCGFNAQPGQTKAWNWSPLAPQSVFRGGNWRVGTANDSQPLVDPRFPQRSKGQIWRMSFAFFGTWTAPGLCLHSGSASVQVHLVYFSILECWLFLLLLPFFSRRTELWQNIAIYRWHDN